MHDKSASQQIDDIIKTYGGWKGEVLSQIRAAILASSPGITEEIKWKMASRPEGLPVWSHQGILCYTETWKDNIKLLFAKGAQLQDTDKIFNARLNSSALRAIELHEGDAVNGPAIQKLVLSAIEVNQNKAS
ncbi:DUF1801 domain-containing protein [Candidatus Saccharibacteria bacterium]|nr:MAG: DUF1801 domain-containing protein [Candidatus Saccharibacteria bacterium]